MHDQSEEPLVVVVVEGWEAAQQDVQDDPHGPDVHLAAVWLVLQDLGSHVARSTARLVHALIGA